MKKILQLKPMLAAEPKSKGKLDQKYIDEILDDPNWIGEEKLDGSRYLAHFHPDRIYFTSRRTSVVNGLQVEKGLNLPHLNRAVPKLVGTVLDGEIVTGVFGSHSSDVTSVMGSLPAEAIDKQRKGDWVIYVGWDVLYYKGRNVMNLSLRCRHVLLRQSLAEWHSRYVKGVEGRGQDDKRDFLNHIWRNGGEGIILKYLDSPYLLDVRNKHYWVKVKMRRTFDVVIMGFTKPDKWTINAYDKKGLNRYYKHKWISAIRFGQYKKGKLIEIGQTSGMSDTDRAFVSQNTKRLVGTVMEVKAQEQFKSGALRHPRFICLRNDKDRRDCKLKDI